MEYIKRDLEDRIRSYLNRKEIIAIIGARQSGKTTIMQHIFKDLKNAKFISFEDRDILRTFREDIKLFIKQYVEETDFLFIDEFQYAKEGGKSLKFIYDEYPIKIIISGSSAAELSIQSIKYLVGRIFILTLSPLSFKEFLAYKDKRLSELYLEKDLSKIAIEKINSFYKEFIIFGSYPAVVLSKTNQEKIEVLKNIYNTYLLREVREILQIADEERLIRLMKALALQTGGLINYQELSSLTGFIYKDLIKNIEILKKTFICLESRPFYTNKRKELVKNPKIFFLDSGFRNIIINNFQNTENRGDLGDLNENFVASELFKNDFRLHYWRTKAKAEVDFVIEKNNKIMPIEVKTTLNSPKFGKSFKNFIDEYKLKEGYILSMSYMNKIKIGSTNVHFIPIFLISKIISSP